MFNHVFTITNDKTNRTWERKKNCINKGNGKTTMLLSYQFIFVLFPGLTERRVNGRKRL